MRVGVQYVRQSPRMRAVLVRAFLFFLQSNALLALLPLVAQRVQGGGAGTFTLMLASMGTGAIVAALALPRLRSMGSQRSAREPLVRGGTLVLSAGDGGRGAGAEPVAGAAGDADRRHGVDHGRQHAHDVGATGAARLGARARHVDLPDGADGRCSHRRRVVGPGGVVDRRARQRAAGRGPGCAGDAAGKPALRYRRRRRRRRDAGAPMAAAAGARRHRPLGRPGAGDDRIRHRPRPAPPTSAP